MATLRGSASVMAAALGARKSTDLIVQLCGDTHLSNFGIYASPERDLVFDVNDFDETHPGPFEWAVPVRTAREKSGFKAGLRRREKSGLERG